MSTKISTRSTLGPVDKFLLETGLVRSSLPAGIENMIMKIVYYENHIYNKMQDQNIDKSINDVDKAFNLLYGIVLDKSMFDSIEYDMLYVWCNECHEWHRFFCNTSDIGSLNPEYISADSCGCKPYTNDIYSMAKNARITDLESYMDTGYYMLPIIRCYIDDKKYVMWETRTNKIDNELNYCIERCEKDSCDSESESDTIPDRNEE